MIAESKIWMKSKASIFHGNVNSCAFPKELLPVKFVWNEGRLSYNKLYYSFHKKVMQKGYLVK